MIGNDGDTVVVEGVVVVEHAGDVGGDVKVGGHMSDNDYELIEHNKGLDGEYDETITSFLCFSSRSYH